MTFLEEDPLFPKRKRKRRIAGIEIYDDENEAYILDDDFEDFPLFLFYGLSH